MPEISCYLYVVNSELPDMIYRKKLTLICDQLRKSWKHNYRMSLYVELEFPFTGTEQLKPVPA